MLIAHVVALQIQGTIPGPTTFTFAYDSTVAGMTANGLWQARTHKRAQTIIRAINHYLQSGYKDHHVSWEHVPAHQGHPWNEAADAIAKMAAMKEINTHDHEEWEAGLLPDDPHAMGVQWMWLWEEC